MIPNQYHNTVYELLMSSSCPFLYIAAIKLEMLSFLPIFASLSPLGTKFYVRKEYQLCNQLNLIKCAARAKLKLKTKTSRGAREIRGCFDIKTSKFASTKS